MREIELCYALEIIEDIRKEDAKLEEFVKLLDEYMDNIAEWEAEGKHEEANKWRKALREVWQKHSRCATAEYMGRKARKRKEMMA